MKFIYFSVCLLFTLSFTANGAEFNRPGWYVVKECCPAVHITPEEAQLRALESARRTAVERDAATDL